MIWEYKTILFEFSKDGLLSDRYVDDEEMESNLNQLGQQGWELVNVSLLQDGLLAFMKRPADNVPLLNELSPREQTLPDASRAGVQPGLRTPPPVQGSLRGTRPPRLPVGGGYLRERLEQREETVQEQRPLREAPVENDRIGGIRIS